MTDDVHIEITNGDLLLPLTGVDSRFFSRENLSRAVGKISRAVGGNVVSDNHGTYVHCLKDINISLKSGDRLGLIGHNGAGKTSLLKVLAGIYPLGAGQLSVSGSVSTFISQGLGMNPEMNAINYLELQCIVRNYNKEQTQEFIEEVLEFIELGDFVYMPIRTYSSGMRARLFASAALFFPSDILIIDEGIGAGDSQFGEKFNAKLETFFESAKIMVFATHSRPMLENWCSEVAVMEKGQILCLDEIGAALEYYDEVRAHS